MELICPYMKEKIVKALIDCCFEKGYSPEEIQDTILKEVMKIATCSKEKCAMWTKIMDGYIKDDKTGYFVEHFVGECRRTSSD